MNISSDLGLNEMQALLTFNMEISSQFWKKFKDGTLSQYAYLQGTHDKIKFILNVS